MVTWSVVGMPEYTEFKALISSLSGLDGKVQA